jgi:hypothetical protein
MQPFAILTFKGADHEVACPVMAYTYLLAVLVALTSCAEKAPVEPPLPAGHLRPGSYSLGHLRIWPTVDTTDALNAEAIACLRRFCQFKLDTSRANDFWLITDLERFGGIHGELFAAEFDSVGEPRYPPTLLAIRNTGNPDERLLTVRWAEEDGAGIAKRVRYVFDFLAKRTGDGVRLSFPLDHLTRDWERIGMGPVTFIVSPRRTFSMDQAQQQVKDMERLARFFDIPPFPITFYSCTDPTELFRIRGYQQHPLMHVFPTGGRAEGKDLVFSGNDKEIYTHEVVHLFTGKKFQDRPWVLDEGLATLLAGSSEQSYTWHRTNLKAYLASGAMPDMEKLLTSYEPSYINGHTNLAYAIGGVLCERILRTQGKEGLFAVLASGEEHVLTALAGMGITRENLRQELVKELVLEPYALNW